MFFFGFSFSRPRFQPTNGGEGEGAGSGNENETENANEDEKNKGKGKSQGKGNENANKDDDAAKAAKAKADEETKALKAQLKKYQDKEKAEEDAKKSAEQLAAEKDLEIKNLRKQNLIEKVRRANGFTDAVFDVVSPDGETEDEIKASFDKHKESLDAYMQAKGVKPAPGTGTTTQTKPTGKEAGKPDKRSYLERIGLVKTQEAV